MIVLAVILIWKVTFQAAAYPSNTMLLTNSAPSLLVLGTINGGAAAAASFSRAVGPIVSGLVQSASLGIGCLGIAWWSSGAIAVIGAIECLWMIEPRSTPTAPLIQSEDDLRAQDDVFPTKRRL